MNYKIIVTFIIVIISTIFTSCCSLQKYYSDENDEVYFTESSENTFNFVLNYPEYAFDNSSLMNPGNEKYFKLLEGKYYYQIAFGIENNYKLESLNVIILNSKKEEIINEDGMLYVENQTHVYTSFEEVIKNGVPDRGIVVHVFFSKEKLEDVKSIIIKCSLVLSKDKELKQFEFIKKVSSKYRLITPLDFYH